MSTRGQNLSGKMLKALSAQQQDVLVELMAAPLASVLK